MKKVDKKIEAYIKRAKKILDIEMTGDYKNADNLFKMTQVVVEVAKMIQIEERSGKPSFILPLTLGDIFNGISDKDVEEVN